MGKLLFLPAADFWQCCLLCLFFSFSISFFGMFDNLSQHHHIMLLRSNVSILWLVAEKKVAWDLFFVKPERFLWDSTENNLFFHMPQKSYPVRCLPRKCVSTERDSDFCRQETAVALCIPENAPPRDSAKESLFISILFPVLHAVLHAVFHSVLCSVLQPLLQSVFHDFCSGSGFSRIESCGTESDCDDPDCCHGHDSFHVLPPFFSIFVLSELLLSAPSLRMRFFRKIYSFPEKNTFFFKKASLTAKNQSKTG